MCIYYTSSDITVYAAVSTGFDHPVKPGLDILCRMWLDQDKDVKEAEVCCIRRARGSDYIQ
jgi:hypothetical protein